MLFGGSWHGKVWEPLYCYVQLHVAMQEFTSFSVSSAEIRKRGVAQLSDPINNVNDHSLTQLELSSPAHVLGPLLSEKMQHMCRLRPAGQHSICCIRFGSLWILEGILK